MKSAKELIAIAETVEQAPEVMLAIEAQKALLLRGKAPNDKLFADAVKFIDALSTAVIVGAKARDEVIRTLRGAMDAQDERERLAGEKCGVSWLKHGCDWPDEVAERILFLRGKARVE